MDVTDLNRQIQATQAQLAELRGLIVGERGATVRPKRIEDVPGIRRPQTLTLRIAFEVGSTSNLQGTVEVDQDGPFVVTQIRTAFLVTDAGSLVNRYLPVTLFGSAMGVELTNGLLPLAAIVPEFDFKYQLAGSGVFWTGQQGMPGPFADTWNVPNYFAIQGWIDPSDRFVLDATPKLAMPRAGELVMSLTGYRILNPGLRLAQILNYAV